MKTLFTIITTLSLLAGTAVPVFAENGQKNGIGQTMRAEKQERNEDRMKTLFDLKESFKTKFGKGFGHFWDRENSLESFAQIQEDRANRILEQLNKTHDRFENIITRLQTRITETKNAGKDVAKAQEHLDKAKTELARTQTLIDASEKAIDDLIEKAENAVKDLPDEPTQGDWSTVAQSVKPYWETVKQSFKTTRDSLKLVHDHLKESVKALRQVENKS